MKRVKVSEYKNVTLHVIREACTFVAKEVELEDDVMLCVFKLEPPEPRFAVIYEPAVNEPLLHELGIEALKLVGQYLAVNYDASVLYLTRQNGKNGYVTYLIVNDVRRPGMKVFGYEPQELDFRDPNRWT